MVEQNGTGAGQAANAAPRLAVLVQYSKDLSFENPTAPRTLGPQQKGPNISVQINVNARQIGETDYEVNLVLEGGAKIGVMPDELLRTRLQRLCVNGTYYVEIHLYGVEIACPTVVNRVEQQSFLQRR